MSLFINDRAARLKPDEAVLFLYNQVNGSTVNRHEVDISPPLAVDAEGRTRVIIEGRGTTLRNSAGVTGKVDFYYRRTPLDQLSLPVDGSFYTRVVGQPSFLSIVNELKRRTGMNCGPGDFEPTPFNPLSATGYVLKAKAKSWRFQGEVNLGMPAQTQLSSVLQFSTGQLPLSLYEEREALTRQLSTRYTNLDLTAWPQWISRLTAGYELDRVDSDLVGILNGQAGKGAINFTLTPVTNALLNLQSATVEYNGPIRGQDPLGYLPEQDHVIVLVPNALYAPRTLGKLYLYYIGGVTPVLEQGVANVHWLNRLGTAQSGLGEAAFWSSLKVGKPLTQDVVWADLLRAFKQAFGLTYEVSLGQALTVTYNGVLRASDPLAPQGNPQHVLILSASSDRLSPVRGQARVYYD